MTDRNIKIVLRRSDSTLKSKEELEFEIRESILYDMPNASEEEKSDITLQVKDIVEKSLRDASKRQH